MDHSPLALEKRRKKSLGNGDVPEKIHPEQASPFFHREYLDRSIHSDGGAIDRHSQQTLLRIFADPVGQCSNLVRDPLRNDHPPVLQQDDSHATIDAVHEKPEQSQAVEIDVTSRDSGFIARRDGQVTNPSHPPWRRSSTPTMLIVGNTNTQPGWWHSEWT